MPSEPRQTGRGGSGSSLPSAWAWSRGISSIGSDPSRFPHPHSEKPPPGASGHLPRNTLLLPPALTGRSHQTTCIKYGFCEADRLQAIGTWQRQEHSMLCNLRTVRLTRTLKSHTQWHRAVLRGWIWQGLSACSGMHNPHRWTALKLMELGVQKGANERYASRRPAAAMSSEMANTLCSRALMAPTVLARSQIGSDRRFLELHLYWELRTSILHQSK